MADPTEPGDDQEIIVEATGADYHELPNGGVFIAPLTWAGIVEGTEGRAILVWPNGDLSIWTPEKGSAPARWKRYKHGNVEVAK